MNRGTLLQSLLCCGVGGVALLGPRSEVRAEPPDWGYAREYYVQPAPIHYERAYLPPAREVVYVDRTPSYGYGSTYGYGCYSPPVVYTRPVVVYPQPSYRYVSVGFGYGRGYHRPASYARSYFPARPYAHVGHDRHHRGPVYRPHRYPSHRDRGWGVNVGGAWSSHGGYREGSFRYRR